jgi:hypothetical protein
LDRFICPFLRWTSEHEPLLPRDDLLYLCDRNGQDTAAEQPAADDEHVRPVETRPESDLFDNAEPLRRRVDTEAFATAKPIIGIPRQGSGKLEGARHVTPYSRKRQMLLSRRSRSAMLAGVHYVSQERLLLAVAMKA